MAGEVILKSFPFDSMNVLNEESNQMEPDRLYEAEIFRKYFAKFLSNGVYYGHYKKYGENSMKVTADGGLNIKVLPGAGIIEGADFENESERIFTLERPISGNRTDRIIIKLDKTLNIRETQLYIKKGNGVTPAILQRDENIYEICLAEVTVKSTSNITQSDITDRRLNTNLCGIVNSLISVDGEELYKKFQDYIDDVTDNLVRKNQMFAVLEGDLDTAWYNEEVIADLSYPEGFNFNNCVIASCCVGNKIGSEQYHFLSPDETFNSYIGGNGEENKRKWERKVIMQKNKIRLIVKNLNENAAVFFNYRLILLKK